MQVPSLPLLSGLRILCYPELWCRLHVWLGFCMAVAQASSCISDLTPSLVLPYATGTALKSKKEKKKKKEKERLQSKRLKRNLTLMVDN